MADTTFSAGTVVASTWLNDINDKVYNGKSQWTGEVVNVKDPTYGAVGDGVANDTAALNAAFATSGAVFLPKGTYYYTANLDVPVCDMIFGEGEDVTILKPGAAVTIGLEVSTYPRKLSNIQINGVSTNNATGLYLGNSASWGGNVENVRVKNFVGSSGVGVRVGDALKALITCLTSESNYTNFLIDKTTGGFPTTVQFDSCVSTVATGVGVKVIDANSIIFNNQTFESSGAEGLLILPDSGGTAVEVIVNNGWFEDNNGNDTSKYHVVCGDGTSLGSATIRPVFNYCYFDTTGAKAKAIRLNGAAVAGFELNSPRFAASVSGAISVENNAYGSVTEWCRAYNYSTIVSDANNFCANTMGQWTSYTPTYASSTGDAATTYSGAVTTNAARYKLLGSTLYLQVDFSATLNAVTPSYLQVSLPTGLTSQNNMQYVPCAVKDTTTALGFCRTDGGTNLFFYKLDFSNFTSGAAVGGIVNAVIELT